MWNVVGQSHAVDLLERSIQSGRLPHALLFAGRAGIGKTTLALELAKALNCIGDDPPCQACVHCHQIAAGSHPDVSLVTSADGKDSILIEQIRALRDAAALKPFQGRRKVFIVVDAETLTLPAADAMLKTLEEPEEDTVIVLTAVEAEAVVPTIQSRCRVLDLQPIPTVEIARLLESDLGPAEAERIARLARGSVGWAMRAARQPKLALEREGLTIQLAGIFSGDLQTRLDVAEMLSAERRDRTAVRRWLELLLLLARDMLRMNQGLEAQVATGREGAVLAEHAARLDLSAIRGILERIGVAMNRIDQNVDPRLTLEALITGLP